MTKPRFHLSKTDAVEWLCSMPDESVDCIVTDPAYESLEKHRKVGTTTRLAKSKASSNEWFPIFRNERFVELFAELYRVLKRDRHFYLFCDQETMFVTKPIGEDAGFRFWKPIVWDKMSIGMGYHYRARYELILFFEKGKRKLNDLGVPDILTEKRIRGGYPTEKPIPLAMTLIAQSTLIGELVIDPFMGSGFAGAAAAIRGCNFAGTDVTPAAVDLARSRMLPGAEETGRFEDLINGTAQMPLRI